MDQGEKMEPARLDPASEAAIAKTLQIESRRYVAPIWWCGDPYDAGTVLHNGSCFFVTVGGNRFGVTAFHVIAAFLNDLQKFPATCLMIRNTELTNWEDRFIDGDSSLDVATFRVSDQEFQAIGAKALDSPLDKWPPAPPAVGRGLIFTGYPGVDRSVLGKKAVEFVQSSNGVVVASVGPDDIEITIDPAHLISIDGKPIPPTSKNLGGYSGAPALVVSAGLASLFWLGGVIIRQFAAQHEKDATTVWARRPNCILPNGQLVRSRHARDGL
jgi:hypothetical protein